MRFGLSTRLFAGRPLQREHLTQIAAHGFEAIELSAGLPHFDCRDAGAIARLDTWLRDAGVTLHGIRVPSATGQPEWSTASSDEGRRAAAVEAMRPALDVARRIGASVFVVQLGATGSKERREDNDRRAACRTLEELHRHALPLGVRLAVEVRPNRLSAVQSLTRLLEDDVDLPDAGICLDYGHAFLMGNLLDAIEAGSGHVVCTHVHDNHGRRDEHLVPFEGAIDWPAALMATQKIGYDGMCMFDLGPRRLPALTLASARRVKARFERLLA